MAIMRSKAHAARGRTPEYVASVMPVGYPQTALICGSVHCQESAFIWLEPHEKGRQRRRGADLQGVHSLDEGEGRFEMLTPPQIVQSLAVLLGLLSGWAWMKSAMLQVRPDDKRDWLDRISKKPIMWNAIAAFLASATAVTQAIVFLMTMPK